VNSVGHGHQGKDIVIRRRKTWLDSRGTEFVRLEDRPRIRHTCIRTSLKSSQVLGCHSLVASYGNYCTLQSGKSSKELWSSYKGKIYVHLLLKAKQVQFFLNTQSNKLCCQSPTNYFPIICCLLSLRSETSSPYPADTEAT
jgi:hypothetical protein